MTPETFWTKVDQSDGPNACWEWLGKRKSQLGYEYGLCTFNGKSDVRAHRVAWELANSRTVDDGMVIRHECDNPPCCNPAHLVEGTPKQNSADMAERGRGWWQKDTCPKGHAWTSENTLPIAGSDGRWKRCRQCMRDNVAKRAEDINARRRERYQAKRETILAERREKRRARSEAQSGNGEHPSRAS